MSRRAGAAVTAAALWLHDRCCVGYNAPRPYCTGEGRIDHARRTQREMARRLHAASTIDELARLLHDAMCPAWLERSHGDYYVARSERLCGPGGDRHVARMAESATVGELAKLVGLDARN